MKTDRRSIVLAITALPAVGHLSVAAIYITMGLLTGFLSIGLRHQSPDLRAAIQAIKEQPLGPLLLFSLIICSCALALWRGLQAFADLEDKGKKFPGLIQRGRLVASSLIYCGMSVLIGRMLLNQPVPSGEQVARDSASTLVIHPLGWILLVTAGLTCIGVGGFYAYRAAAGNFHAWFRTDQMSLRQQAWCFAMGRLGYASRSVILVTIGYFLTVAGYHVRPDHVTGQAGAVQAIFHQPLGPWIVALIGVGLIAHGIFALASARFGKIPEKKIEEVVASTARADGEEAGLAATAAQN